MNKNKINDFWLLSVILLYSFLLSYFAPATVARIGYLPLLFFAYRSNNNSLWFIILLVFIDNPAYFFYGGEKNAIGRTPLYPFISGGISFNELLAFTLILKATLKKKTKIFYEKGLIIAIFILIVTFLVSFIYKVNADSLIDALRRITMWIFIFALPQLLKTSDSWARLLRLAFPFVFIILLDQMHIFFKGMPIAGLFNTEISLYHAMKEVDINSSQASRAFSGPALNFIAFTGSLIVYPLKKKPFDFHPNYLVLISLSAFATIIFSATRGWFISYSFLLIIFLSLFLQKKSFGKPLLFIILAFVASFLIVNSSQVLDTQANNAIDRFATLSAIAQGDLTAEGTLGRVTDYTPVLIERIKSNPFGYGFSAKSFELENDHVGLLNPMIIFGIFGYLILIYMLFAYKYSLFKLYKRLSNQNPMKNSLLISLFSFLALFIIHSTSRQIFGLNRNININIIYPVLFSFSNWIIYESYRIKNLYIENPTKHEHKTPGFKTG